jgi:MFS family permease
MVRDRPYVSPAVFGLMMTSSAAAYACQLPLCFKLLETKSRRYVMYIGWIIFCISQLIFVVDPGNGITSFTKGFLYTLAMMIFGFGYGMIVTPMLPEIQDSVCNYYNKKNIKFD